MPNQPRIPIDTLASAIKIHRSLGINTLHLNRNNKTLLDPLWEREIWPHLPATVRMNHINGPLVQRTSYGWRVNIPTGTVEDIEEEYEVYQKLGYDDTFIALLRLGQELCLDWLEFDADAPDIPGYPKFIEDIA